MDWFLVIIHLTMNNEVAGSERRYMQDEQECRRTVDSYEPKVLSGNLWVRCEASNIQTASNSDESEK